MSEKYYTPTTAEELLSFIISEKCCYTKFRGESKLCGDKMVFAGGIVEDLFNFIKANNYDTDKGWSIDPTLYLIPCLSKEDIESFGFRHNGGKLMRSAAQYYGNGKFEICYSERDMKLEINRIHREKGAIKSITQLFSGTIKNKGEFRTILQQTGIINDK